MSKYLKIHHPAHGYLLLEILTDCDQGDQRFVLEMDEDSNYYIEFPSGFGRLEYKLTRGDWTSVETDICGFDIDNHSFEYGSADTWIAEVLS